MSESLASELPNLLWLYKMGEQERPSAGETIGVQRVPAIESPLDRLFV